MSNLVEVRRDGDVAILTLSRPEKLNAISTEVERALAGALDDESVTHSRALVLTGEGRAFSAGADITEFQDRDPAAIVAYYRETGSVYERFAAFPIPTLAAIHGYCLGGALELALAADFRIADDSAIFGLPEVELGILPSSGGTHRLVRLLGTARAKEIALLRERFDAHEALRVGLVTEVVPAGSALRRAVELATRLAELPPLAVSLTKEAIDAMGESSRQAAMLMERAAYAALAQTDEARAGVDGFTCRKRASH
jgi:enoyl-CoA hydratase/carnithine racemase